jgi:hypothetical protein
MSLNNENKKILSEVFKNRGLIIQFDDQREIIIISGKDDDNQKNTKMTYQEVIEAISLFS